MITIRNIVSNNKLLSLGGNVLSAGLSFLSIAILARVLDKEAFGTWNLYILTATFLELFRSGFLQTTLVRYFSIEDESGQKTVLGSLWLLGFIITCVLSLLPFVAPMILPSLMEREGSRLFLLYFPILNFLTLPHYFAAWTLQAKEQFGKLLALRFVLLGSFSVYLVWFFMYPQSVQHIIIAHMICNVLGSLLSILFAWSGIQYIGKFNFSYLLKMLHFGKYSTGTILGGSLLRSSDNYILNFMLNTSTMAIYSIPQRIIEIVEIPLRSFAATVLPEFSKHYADKNSDKIKETFYRYCGSVTIMLLPILLVMFVFSDWIILLIAGSKYIEYHWLVRIFTLYCLFLPFDRFAGLLLDVYNKPAFNFYRVLILIIVNAIADIVILRYTQNYYYMALGNVAIFALGTIIFYFKIQSMYHLKIAHMLAVGWKVLEEYATLREKS